MSAYKNIETKFNDKQCLVEALNEIGYKEVEVHDEAVKLVGYHGDERADTAEIVIRRKNIGSVSNDIGFKKDESGHYKAIISDYDSGKHNKNWLNKLSQIYSKKKVMKTCRQNGFVAQGKPVENNGKITMRFKVSN